MKTWVFILGSFTPIPSANGVCVRNIICKIDKEDEVFVICYNNRNSIDYFERNVQVVTVNRSLIFRIIDFLDGFKPRIFDKSLGTLSKTASRFLSRLAMFYRSYSYPLIDNKFITNCSEVLNEITLKKKVDYIIGVTSPMESLKVVARASSNAFKIAYLLDTISGGNLPKYLPSVFLKRRLLEFERMVFNNFDIIIAMSTNKFIKNEAMKYSLHNIEYLDPPLYSDKLPVDINSDFYDGLFPKRYDFIYFLYAGTLDKQRSLDWLISLISLSSFQIIILIAGKVTIKISQVWERHIIILGEMDRRLLSYYYQLADVLLNIGVNNNQVITSKLYEYLIYKKKILQLIKSSEDSSIELLKGLEGVILIEEGSDPYKYLDAFDEFLRSSVFPDVSKIQERLYKSTPDAFLNLISDISE